MGLFLFSIHDKTEAENWKLFFKDGDGTWYYDKDSIHYPYNTKGFLGSIKTDKNIVRVWTKFEDRIIFLEELRCSQRESQTIEYQSLKKDLSFLSFFPDQPEGTKPLPGEVVKTFNNYRGQQRIPIIPGSRREKLYNEVCK